MLEISCGIWLVKFNFDLISLDIHKVLSQVLVVLIIPLFDTFEGTPSSGRLSLQLKCNTRVKTIILENRIFHTHTHLGVPVKVLQFPLPSRFVQRSDKIAKYIIVSVTVSFPVCYKEKAHKRWPEQGWAQMVSNISHEAVKFSSHIKNISASVH